MAAAVVGCGLAVLGPAPAEAIVGGQAASTKTYPWVVALTTPVLAYSFCGGTLVAPTKVLTAGHCVDQFIDQPSLIHVIAGRDDMATGNGVDVPVFRIWRDPGYSTFTFVGETGYRNDLAVLTLSRPVPYPTLPIAKPHQHRLYRPGAKARILG